MSEPIAPGACVVCNDPSTDPICDDCLRRIGVIVGNAKGIATDDAWAIAVEMVASDVRAERRQQEQA